MWISNGQIFIQRRVHDDASDPQCDGGHLYAEIGTQSIVPCLLGKKRNWQSAKVLLRVRHKKIHTHLEVISKQESKKRDSAQVDGEASGDVSERQRAWRIPNRTYHLCDGNRSTN